MPTGDVEVYHEGGQWHVRIQGRLEPASSHGTKEEAVERGKMLAAYLGSQKTEGVVELIVKNLDGTMSGEKNSYPRSRDPRRSKG